MFQGIVVKAYNGFYYVKNTSKITMCTLRGRIKKERFSLLVGDSVVYTLTGQEKGVIERILPRRSILTRPMVANVDQVIITFAAANPDMNVELLDRFLVLAELAQLKAYLCINKTELVEWGSLQPVIELYESIGYDVIALSAKTEIGVKDLRHILYDRISVFAGPSGVGKSTILNLIEPGFQLETGEVSEKIGRGRHTTRFAQLLPLTGGGYVVDTPGFSFTEFSNLREPELTYCFREIALQAAQCKFASCLHVKEPQCAVKEAVLSGKIAQSRYNSYLAILEELKEQSSKF
ncbi:putative ribosome biogenesis GTPase RsgA [Propionispora sp. 2/2-37]|uniref:ribosome small subunit-dependent GTPase A n=1 Tax=Propionispora sp. 2/2-37 TaxID=1677858 RepID=UPI0006BB8E2C|nr:ribosome small subunit-dependent GTPase A [Propionispora sp. 2/2-37]CUH94223.1 putative ribosome biogenesis GTPase RsgA [Propionispora sp. 2/2-37]